MKRLARGTLRGCYCKGSAQRFLPLGLELQQLQQIATLYHLNVLGCEVLVYVWVPSMHRATVPTSTLVQ